MSEKRHHRRVSCLVEAQLWCRDKDVHWDVQLTAIGEGGCFVNALVPLEDGSPVSLKINDGSGSLEVPGKILYGQPSMGSAIAFDPMDNSVRLQIQNIIVRAEA